MTIPTIAAVRDYLSTCWNPLAAGDAYHSLEDSAEGISTRLKNAAATCLRKIADPQFLKALMVTGLVAGAGGVVALARGWQEQTIAGGLQGGLGRVNLGLPPGLDARALESGVRHLYGERNNYFSEAQQWHAQILDSYKALVEGQSIVNPESLDTIEGVTLMDLIHRLIYSVRGPAAALGGSEILRQLAAQVVGLIHPDFDIDSDKNSISLDELVSNGFFDTRFGEAIPTTIDPRSQQTVPTTWQPDFYNCAQLGQRPVNALPGFENAVLRKSAEAREVAYTGFNPLRLPELTGNDVATLIENMTCESINYSDKDYLAPFEQITLEIKKRLGQLYQDAHANSVLPASDATPTLDKVSSLNTDIHRQGVADLQRNIERLEHSAEQSRTAGIAMLSVGMTVAGVAYVAKSWIQSRAALLARQQLARQDAEAFEVEL